MCSVHITIPETRRFADILPEKTTHIPRHLFNYVNSFQFTRRLKLYDIFTVTTGSKALGLWGHYLLLLIPFPTGTWIYSYFKILTLLTD